MLQFLVYPQYTDDGIPIYVEILFDFSADEPIPDDPANLAEIVANMLKEEIIKMVSNYNGWSRRKILSKVKGFPQGSNNSNNKSLEGDLTNLENLKEAEILQIIDNIQQSVERLKISDLNWSYYISPNSIIAGGNASFPIPSWVNSKMYRSTWQNHYLYEEKINCAAYAIYCGLKKFSFGKNTISLLTRNNAMKLQKRFGWGDYVTVEDLERFVEYYSEYKLSVLIHKGESTTNYYGKRYVFDKDHPLKNAIYLYYHYDTKQDIKHYAYIHSPLSIYKDYKGYKKWCFHCDQMFTKSAGHTCDENLVEAKQQKRTKVLCQHCDLYYTKCLKKQHMCHGIKCKSCFLSYKKTEEYIRHRCPLTYETKKKEENYSFLVYDLESRFEAQRSSIELITSFKLDEDGYYLQEDIQEAAVYGFTYDSHVANLVCVKDIITNQEWNFFGEDCLKDFVLFCLNYNEGKNVLLAHNSSGYDLRLIMSSLKTWCKEKMKPILNGSKIIQLKVKDLIFHDVMLHIPGSLKSLANDFKCNSQKGDFPFMFNRLENYDYNGPIPGLEFFSLQTRKTTEDRNALLKWHSEFKGDWNFKDQLLLYCQNDVAVLGEIAKAYHEVWMEKGLVPFMKPTGPSVVNQFMGQNAWQQFCKENNSPENIDFHSKENYEWLGTTNFKDKWWTVATPYEHFFAKAALRGGRTEVKKMYYKLSDEDEQKGRKIMYVDVCSLYPFQQVIHEFPVGVPTIYYFNNIEFAGCNKPEHYRQIKCNCRIDEKLKSPHTYSFKKFSEMKPIDEWFGFVSVTLKPPKDLIHPLIVHFDEEKNKCLATLRDEDCKEIVIGTKTFQMALKHGYELVKVHSYHEYHKGNFWREPTLKLYLEKMMNSKNAPETDEEKEAFIKKYAAKYGEDFGNQIRESWPRWGKFAAKKLVAKLTINSVWGKHAQRVDFAESCILDINKEYDEVTDIFNNFEKDKIQVTNINFLSDTLHLFSTKVKNAKINLHKQYLPTAVFVPEYGRLQLWEQMNKLGERVLYCDTDSIVYIYDPEKYNVPTGDMLGDWEVEDICKREISEFVAFAPKTYGIKCKDGYESIKAKGVSLTRATEKIFNFEVMRNTYFTFMKENHVLITNIPGFNFNWSFQEKMKTTFNFKKIMIQENDIKGKLQEDGTILPFGYEK